MAIALSMGIWPKNGLRQLSCTGCTGVIRVPARNEPMSGTGANLLLSVGIRSYPFTLEPSGSVGIPRILTADTNGNRRFLPERIRINMNGEERIPSRNTHGANPLLSVGIRSYPFTLEPYGSVGIPRILTTDTNGNRRFLLKRIATNMNGEERI